MSGNGGKYYLWMFSSIVFFFGLAPRACTPSPISYLIILSNYVRSVDAFERLFFHLILYFRTRGGFYTRSSLALVYADYCLLSLFQIRFSRPRFILRLDPDWIDVMYRLIYIDNEYEIRMVSG